MNLTHLEYLAKAVDLGGYTNAAKALYVTPQTISKAISELEKELDVTLFKKAGRGVTATEDALRLAEMASTVLDEIAIMRNYAKAKSKSIANVRSFSLGLSSTLCKGSPLDESDFINFKTKHPDLMFTTLKHSNEACISALIHGLVEAAIVVGGIDSPNINCMRIGSAPLSALALRGSDLDCGEITFSSLSRKRIALPDNLSAAYFLLKDALARRSMFPELATICPDPADQKSFIDEGGVTLAFANATLPDIYDDITLVPLTKHDEIRCPIFLICIKENVSPLIHELLQHARKSLLKRENG